MPRFALSQRTSATSAGSAAWEIRVPSTMINRVRLLEFGISQNAATAGVFGIGRPAAIGVTPTSPVNFLPLDPGEGGVAPAGNTTACVAWGTPPTVPTQFYWRMSFQALVGTPYVWWPEQLFIQPGWSLVLWIIATAPVCDVWAIINEP